MVGSGHAACIRAKRGPPSVANTDYGGVQIPDVGAPN